MRCTLGYLRLSEFQEVHRARVRRHMERETSIAYSPPSSKPLCRARLTPSQRRLLVSTYVPALPARPAQLHRKGRWPKRAVGLVSVTSPAHLRLLRQWTQDDVDGASGPTASGSYSAPRAGPGPSTLSQVSSLNAGGSGGAQAGGSQANGMSTITPLSTLTLCDLVEETELTRKPSSSTTIPTKNRPPSAGPHHGILAGLPVAPSAPRNDPRTRTVRTVQRHLLDIPSFPSLRSPHPPPVVPTRSSWTCWISHPWPLPADPHP